MDPNDPNQNQPFQSSTSTSSSTPHYSVVPNNDQTVPGSTAYGFSNQASYNNGPYNSYAPAWNQTSIAQQQQLSESNAYFLQRQPSWGNIPAQQSNHPSNYAGEWQDQTSNFGNYAQPTQPAYQNFAAQGYNTNEFAQQPIFANQSSYLHAPPPSYEQTVSPAAINPINLDEYDTPDEVIHTFETESIQDDVPDSEAAQVETLFRADAGYAASTQSGEPSVPLTAATAVLFAKSVPPSQESGIFFERNSVDLAVATASQQLDRRLPFLHVSKQPITTPGNRPPLHLRLPAKRYSKKQIRAGIESAQSDHAWSSEQLSILKKLNKLKFPIARGRADSRSAAVDSPAGEDESSSEGSEDESDNDAASDASSDASPLPAARPTDPLGALAYDATEIVWSSTKDMNVAEVGDRLTRLGEFVRPLREEYLEAEKTAVAATKGSADAKKFKQKTVDVRRKFDAVITSIVDHGHLALVER